MSKLIIGIIIYLGIGIVIALSPYYYLRNIDNRIKEGDYDSLQAYDLLLFNTVIKTTGKKVGIFIFLSMVLFYPILLISYLRKHSRSRK